MIYSTPDNELILALDTTSKDCSICLTRNNLILAEYNFISNNDLSANIIKIIEFLLGQLNLDISDIDAFGIGVGPGIFTGIRVGLATIKGLVFDSNKKIVPVNILEAIASVYKKMNNMIVSLIDAKRGQVYVAGYSITNNNLIDFCKPSLIDISQLDKILPKNQPLVFAGSGVVLYKDYLQNTFKVSNIVNSGFLSREIAKITYANNISGNVETNIDNVNPLYIRRTDAEENYERNNTKGKEVRY